MATRNGSRYVGEQLNSILRQLGPEDEVIISDDASSDATLAVVRAFNDCRVRILQRHHSIGIVGNFEAALVESKGEIIFLADQDDVWQHNKVDKLLQHLASCDLVISNCKWVDDKLNPLHLRGMKRNTMQKGLLRNLIRNSYMGCCMAFRRNVLMKALPFPKDIPMHDIWIGLVSEMHFRVAIERDELVLHRRHQHNATTTGFPTQFSLRKQFADRYRILKNLIFHKAYAA